MVAQDSKVTAGEYGGCRIAKWLQESIVAAG